MRDSGFTEERGDMGGGGGGVMKDDRGEGVKRNGEKAKKGRL